MKIIYLETREKMKIIDIYFVIFQEEFDLLLIIEYPRSEKSQNEHFGINLQIG